MSLSHCRRCRVSASDRTRRPIERLAGQRRDQQAADVVIFLYREELYRQTRRTRASSK